MNQSQVEPLNHPQNPETSPEPNKISMKHDVSSKSAPPHRCGAHAPCRCGRPCSSESSSGVRFWPPISVGRAGRAESGFLPNSRWRQVRVVASTLESSHGSGWHGLAWPLGNLVFHFHDSGESSLFRRILNVDWPDMTCL